MTAAVSGNLFFNNDISFSFKQRVVIRLLQIHMIPHINNTTIVVLCQLRSRIHFTLDLRGLMMYNISEGTHGILRCRR